MNGKNQPYLSPCSLQCLDPSSANTQRPWTSTALRRSNASDQSDALSELRVPVLVTRLIPIFTF